MRVNVLLVALLATLVASQTARADVVAADTFSRLDGSPSADSLGATEVGSFDWSEHAYTGSVPENRCSITSGQLRIQENNGKALLHVNLPDGAVRSQLRFVLGDEPDGILGVTGCYHIAGYLPRMPIVNAYPGQGSTSDGVFRVSIYPSGSITVNEQAGSSNTLHYTGNPFHALEGSEDVYDFLGAGALPTSLNGLPFDVDGDGRLESGEPFLFGVDFTDNNLIVRINNAAVVTASLSGSGNLGNNYLALFRNNATMTNRTSGTPYFDNLAINVPEPASTTLLGLGLVGLAGCLWRRRLHGA